MTKKFKTRKRRSKRKQENIALRSVLLSLGIIICVGLLFSCLSFNIADWPSKYASPHNRPSANWCGAVGAFCAYYLLYYFGPGIFLVLIYAITVLGIKLVRRPMEQPVFRGIGLALLTIAVSSTFFCLWPNRVFAFPFGSGGILGVAVMTFLRRSFAALGTFILITSIWLVGLILLADSMVIKTSLLLGGLLVHLGSLLSPAWSATRERSEALADIWQRLSTRQKTRHTPLSPSIAHTEEIPSAYEDTDTLQAHDKYMEDVAEEEIEEPVSQEERLERIKTLSVQRRATRQTRPSSFKQPSYEDYTLPPLNLLAEPEYGYAAVQEKVVKSKAATLEKLLSEFNVTAHVVAAETGPVVTMFELELAAGIKVSQISNLANDIARALGAGSVRVVAPIPGKHTIGIEVPNNEKEKVRVRNMMELAGQRPASMQLPLFLGKDSSGEALVSDLAKMPHLLIAGTTGSGKSVCINSIIVGLLLTKRPDEVKLILVDPKMVEMTAFNTVPHLMCPIVTETHTAVQILEWATVKMDERYAVLAEARVKNVEEFNRLGADEIRRRFDPSTPDEEAQIPKKLPYIVIIIDELADLMMTAAKEIEAYVVRLAQKSRAVGIHMVLATQRPQATVVTGLIKSNMPCRIGFRVAARMDSRIILDQNGAETLLGEGDMLFLKPGTSDLIRAQGTFLDDMEIKRIVKHLKDIAEPQFHHELTQLKHVDTGEINRDEMFDEAVRVVLETKRGSVSLLQRRLSIGYARASRIIEMMAAAGILGEYKGSQAREVLMTLEEYEQLCQQMESNPPEHDAGPPAEHIEDEAFEDAYEEEDNNDEAEEKPAHVYVSEGQREYISMDTDDD